MTTIEKLVKQRKDQLLHILGALEDEAGIHTIYPPWSAWTKDELIWRILEMQEKEGEE